MELIAQVNTARRLGSKTMMTDDDKSEACDNSVCWSDLYVVVDR